MTDWSELKRLAEAEIALREIGKTADGEPEWIEAEELFDEAIGDVPKTFLALIAENEALKARLEVDDSHPYDGIACRDATIDGLQERVDQLKAELERVRADRGALRDLLREFATRYRSGVGGYLDLVERIDAAMGKGGRADD